MLACRAASMIVMASCWAVQFTGAKSSTNFKFLPSHTCGSHTRMDPPVIFFGPQTGVKDGAQCAEYCEDEGAGAALYYAHDASVNPGYCECRTKRCAHENHVIHHDGSVRIAPLQHVKFDSPPVSSLVSLRIQILNRVSETPPR